MMFLVSVLATVIGALVGVVLGIPAAMAIDRFIRLRTVRRERLLLRDALLGTIEWNCDLFYGYDSENFIGIPELDHYTPTDRVLLDATAYRKWEILDSPDACRAVDQARFALLHLDNTLLRLMHTTSSAGRDPDRQKEVSDVKRKAMNDVGLALRSLEEARTRLRELD